MAKLSVDAPRRAEPELHHRISETLKATIIQHSILVIFPLLASTTYPGSSWDKSVLGPKCSPGLGLKWSDRPTGNWRHFWGGQKGRNFGKKLQTQFCPFSQCCLSVTLRDTKTARVPVDAPRRAEPELHHRISETLKRTIIQHSILVIFALLASTTYRMSNWDSSTFGPKCSPRPV